MEIKMPHKLINNFNKLQQIFHNKRLISSLKINSLIIIIICQSLAENEVRFAEILRMFVNKL